MAAGIHVEGLRELRRELKHAGDRFPKELREANKQAAEVVAPEMRRRAPRGPHEGGGRVRPIVASVRALATQQRAQVAVGGVTTPHAAAWNYGGTLRRFHSTSRTRVPARPYVEPAVKAKTDEVVELYGDALDRITRRAFPVGA